MTDDAPAYAEAIVELEAIVAGLERADIDVDELAARVARAAELIKLCRDRIDRTRIEVDRIVADLDDA
jgi:exodeoxyribonuclease VII small subunit